MSDYPSLAEVVDETCDTQSPFRYRGGYGLRDLGKNVELAWREACTIRSVEQLDALPAQSVIRDDIGDRDGYVYEKSPDGEGDVPWWHDGDPTNVDEIDLPALLIFHPDWSKP